MLEMMTNPRNWPLYPKLPLKRIRGGKAELGFLLAERKVVMEPRVYFEEGDGTSYTYGSFGAILDDGWEVD